MLKKSMKRRYWVLLFWTICFCLFCANNAWGNEEIQSSQDQGREYQIPKDALDLATDYYQRSGLEDYFGMSSLLWTETIKRRNDLQMKLPPIDPDLVRKFRAELANVITQTSNIPELYILAGQYQLYKGQYESALWNFQQAFQLKPESTDARNALADYFLSRWQSDEVISLLKGGKDPDSLFRLGEAYCQKNDYFAALGYLTQADPLTGEFAATRNKDMVKALLAIGEITLAKQSIQENLRTPLNNPIRETLDQELQGWIAWLEGNDSLAQVLWTQGKVANPDYGLWYSILGWLRPNTLPANQSSDFSANPKGDADFNSQQNIARGLNEFHLKKYDTAYSYCLTGIKSDHRSLIGFLAAARSQFSVKKYFSAANLCYQGLAVNPKFRPLLELKADVDAKLGKKDDVIKDHEILKKGYAESGYSGKLSGALYQTPYGKTMLLIQGETKSLTGVWLSADGFVWQYQPWWGGPVYLKKTASQWWVLPCGKELSGEVLLVHKKDEPANALLEKTASATGDGLSMHFSAYVEVFAAFFGNDHLTGSFYSGNSLQNHLIPFSNAGRDSREISVWYRNSNRSIGVTRYKLTIPSQSKIFKYHLEPEISVTNRRKIRLKLTWDSDSAIADRMAVSEGNPSAPADWRKIEAEIPFELSDGDGEKEILLRLIDRDGNSAEIKTTVLLDTIPPQIVDLKLEDNGPDKFKLHWITNKPCQAWIRFLSSKGEWQKEPVQIESGNAFDGVVPSEISYCTINLTDQAGNSNELPISALNDRFDDLLMEKFIINNGTGFVNSRNIKIAPSKIISQPWSVSNDLKTWLPPVQGGDFVLWRLNAGEGEKLVYIKIMNGDNGQTCRIIPLSVVIDTTAPSIKNIIITQSNDGYLINAEFSEPVCLSNEANSASSYKVDQTWKIKSGDGITDEAMKINVMDRAGNKFELIPDLKTAVETPEK